MHQTIAGPVTKYFLHQRAELLPFVPQGISRILDVGCGAGAFASSLRKARRVEAWGIELDPSAAAEARGRLDHVIEGGVESAVATLPKKHFDLISFLDVLEHLVEPSAALRNVLPLLRPGGHVLVSLPNIRFFNAMRRIVIDADFPQEEEGIFDRTHLRWFTEKSMVRLVNASGYSIERMEGINPAKSLKLSLLNLITNQRFRDSRYLQFAILATPTIAGETRMQERSSL